MRLVGKIGGHLGRKSDGEPGNQILWQGYREFQFMCLGFSLFAAAKEDEAADAEKNYDAYFNSG